MDSCPNCGTPFQATEDTCSACNEHLGFPNVRAAEEPTERDALRQRYKEAIDRAAARGAKAAVENFEAEVKRSLAVINCDVYRLRELIVVEKALYANYYLGVRSEVRRAADVENDRQRRSVDALLFGAYADKLRNAALSIDGKGLTSYGAYSVVLREVAVAKRASLLEENSYSFVARHNLKPSEPIPIGYRCAWANRHELAIAKLGDIIEASTPPADYPRVLLSDKGKRADDDFIEVYIYGSL